MKYNKNNRTQFKSTPPPPEDLTSVTTVIDDFYGIMQNYNTEFFQSITTKDLLEIIREMKLDSQIKSDFEVLVSFIESEKYEIKDDGVKNATWSEYLKNTLTKNGGKLLAMTSRLLDALLYGKTVTEIVWNDPKNNNGKWEVKNLIFLNPEEYSFNNEGELIEVLTDEVINKDFKYLVVSHDVTGNNLNGTSEFLAAYWPWIFKKECMKQGVLYAQKSIIPSLIALVKASSDVAETKKRTDTISNAIASIKNSSGIAMANVDDVKQFNATAKGEDIIDLIYMFDRMISKSILGTPKFTNETKYSNSETRETQEAIIKRKGQKIAKLELQPAINELLRYILELNFNIPDGAEIPYFEYSYKYDPTLDEILQTVDRGIPISKAWLYEKFNIKEAESDEDSFISPKNTLAEPQQFRKNQKDSFFLSRQGTRLIESLKNRSEQ